jgi:MoxR-like ATPase
MVQPEKKPKADINRIKETAAVFKENISKVIVGKRDAVEYIFLALLCEGHVLIEDVPGVGKTQLAKAAAQSFGYGFKRIQCTPDLLPSDITGIQYFNQKTSEFEFRPGPIMTNIVVVDEINRSMPKTQSCLLECMQERQVTVDLTTLSLPRPFMIIATQNPIELEGTFPLPEAQLDRFLLRVGMGHPAETEEDKMIRLYGREDPLQQLESVIDPDAVYDLQEISRSVYSDHSVRHYLLTLVRKTREHPDVKLGASPRASLGLHSACQTLAAMRGRNYIIPDDVKTLIIPVLAHRLLLRTEARLRGATTEGILEQIMSETAVPVE